MKRKVQAPLFGELRPPRLSYSIEIGLEESVHGRVAKRMVFDERRKIEHRIIVTGIFPVDKLQFRRRDDILGNEIIVTAAKIVRQSRLPDEWYTEALTSVAIHINVLGTGGGKSA